MEVFTPQRQRGCVPFHGNRQHSRKWKTKHCWSCYGPHIGSVRKSVQSSKPAWSSQEWVPFHFLSPASSSYHLLPGRPMLPQPGLIGNLRNSPYLQCLLISVTLIHWCQSIFWKRVFMVTLLRILYCFCAHRVISPRYLY